MAKTLGGSLFVRNAIKFGYCVIEALESLHAVCDEISVLECGSDDGTQDLIRRWVAKNSGTKAIKVEYDHPWVVADNYTRLAVLANVARAKLSTDWHFMLQADEVIHESSFETIRHLVNLDSVGAYFCRRLNLYRSPDTCIRFDLTRKGKPCSDVVVRLARTSCPVLGDAESLGGPPETNPDHIDRVVIFHYGYVREGSKHIDKAIDMQSWFHGPGATPDQRIVRMKEAGGYFDAGVFFDAEDVMPIPIPHPVFSRDLAKRLST